MGKGTEDVPVYGADIAGVVVDGASHMTKVKIKSKNPIDAPKPVNGGKAVPEQPQMPERKKESFISVCVGIIKQDIREKIYGEKEGGVKMPKSTESWEDWKDQL